MLDIIQNNLKKNSNSPLFFSRNVKNIIAILLDSTLCIVALWIAFYLRLDQFIPLSEINFLALVSSVSFAIPIFWLTGLYKSIFRFFEKFDFLNICFSVSIYAIFYISTITVYGITAVPRSIGILQPIILFFLLCLFRIAVSSLFIKLFRINRKKLNFPQTLIYGAGIAGRQIASALDNSNEMKVVGFIDDDPNLEGQSLQGINIYSPKDLELIIKSKKITHILLAIPSIKRKKKLEILKKIKDYKIIVRTLPSVIELAQGKVTLSDIRELDVEDILDREVISPDNKLLIKNVKSQIVMITGAGGSIGSELSRQILKLNPEKMILIDVSEYSLYKIQQELEELKKNNISFNKISVICLLGSVQNEYKMREIIKVYRPNTIYHAAAYKHVPIVEENICEGIKNNVFGTLNLVKIALSEKVSNFVLISSDKAVRPTNIMGASKRISEICLQSLSNKFNDKQTNLCIVRFGNVIDSSGSVIPKFKKQIRDGGPITLTHPDVTRYFMTIPEAAQLVIQAGGMAKNAEVFILDMGEPVKIKDLILKMVNLSGLTIQDEINTEGDISIEITGLRPGEKLYEELLLGEDPQPTKHPKIKQAKDPFTKWDQLYPDLLNLENLLNEENVKEVIYVLQKLVKDYQWNGKIQDQIFLQEQKKNFKNI